VWVTLPVVILAALWVPMFSGVLQGRQDFSVWLVGDLRRRGPVSRRGSFGAGARHGAAA